MNRKEMTESEIDSRINEAWLQGCQFGRMAEREKEKKRQLSDIHSCGPDCDRYICVAVRKAREEEREACAKLVESFQRDHLYTADLAGHIGAMKHKMADAIRARGNT